MVEFMITRKNKLKPTLILQFVNNVTNCTKNEKKETLFSVLTKYTQLIQPRLNPGIKKNSRGQGSKFKA